MDQVWSLLHPLTSRIEPIVKDPGKRREFLDWLVVARDPKEMAAAHWSYFYGEICYVLLSLLCLIHAFRSGGRYPALYITTILHGLNTEMIAYWMPDIDNFWHSRTLLMFLGQRLPLYVMVGLYPLVLYVSSCAVARLRLPWWSAPALTGLLAVAIDIPYDILGVKLLWWTWHDTDPNIGERMYWVPWTSYYFHMTFAASFTFLFHGVHRLLSSKPRFNRSNFVVEILSSVLTALLAFPCGVVQFIVLYHTLHDQYKVPSEVCVLTLASIYLVLTVWGLLSPSSERFRLEARRLAARTGRDILSLVVLVHYTFWVFLAITEKPDKIVATGPHEIIGPCNQYKKVPTMTLLGPIENEKRKYFCPTDYDEKYMDFHCLPGGAPPGNNATWYTVCGTPWGNQYEYIAVITAFCVFFLSIYLKLLGLPALPGRGQIDAGTSASPAHKKMKKQ